MSAAPPPIVLVVEDEPAIRDFLADALRLEGYQVLGAEDGLQAVEMLDRQILPSDQPCAVLLDMMLPRVDGLDVLQHLDERGCQVPVVAMSASREHLAAAQAAGADAVLTKPFDLDHLLDVVVRFCIPHQEAAARA